MSFPGMQNRDESVQKGRGAMYARVTRFEVLSGKMEEANRLSSESIIPAIQQQTGFKSFMVLQNPGTGKAMLITVFETEADMKEGVNNGFVQQQVAKIAPLLAGTPLSEFYEVRSQE
ncbi:MAG: hypothetical protein NVS4B1_37410 [Ktedonobacteraceae bacterium]